MENDFEDVDQGMTRGLQLIAVMPASGKLRSRRTPNCIVQEVVLQSGAYSMRLVAL